MGELCVDSRLTVGLDKGWEGKGVGKLCVGSKLC